MVPWLTTDFVLEHFSSKRMAGLKLFERFTEEGIRSLDSLPQFDCGSQDSRIIGSDTFIDEVLSRERPHLRAKSRGQASKLTSWLVAANVCCMARKPRIHVPGGIYHVILRGNDGLSLFYTDADRYRLYLLLQEGVSRFEYRVHAFCCMTNHIHLVLQSGTVSLSAGMQNLSFRYTRWVNKKQGRKGHLFQGRYRAFLVEEESYFLELIRYVHLNPVRAGVCDSPSDYPWTSYQAYVGNQVVPWLTTDFVLEHFSSERRAGIKLFERFTEEGIRDLDSLPQFDRGGQDSRIIGSDTFVDEVLSREATPLRTKITLNQIVQTVCLECGLTEMELKSAGQARKASEGRALVGWLARALGVATFTEVGSLFNRDIGTISSSVRRLEQRAERVYGLRGKMAGVKNMLDDEVANLEA